MIILQAAIGFAFGFLFLLFIFIASLIALIAFSKALEKQKKTEVYTKRQNIINRIFQAILFLIVAGSGFLLFMMTQVKDIEGP